MARVPPNYHYSRLEKSAVFNDENFEIKQGEDYFSEFMMANEFQAKKTTCLVELNIKNDYKIYILYFFKLFDFDHTSRSSIL